MGAGGIWCSAMRRSLDLRGKFLKRADARSSMLVVYRGRSTANPRRRSWRVTADWKKERVVERRVEKGVGLFLWCASQ